MATERLSSVQNRNAELNADVERLQMENTENAALAIRLQSELKSLRESLEQEKQTLADAKTQLVDSFKSLAASALEGNNRQFLELAKSTLAKETESAKGEFEKRQQAIDGLLKPLQETLVQYKTQSQDMERERQRSYANVEAELKRVIETGIQLSSQTAALKDALKRPHVRGRWGEVQLRNCIELAGMSEYADVQFQDVNTDDEGTRLIPDMTVRMPGGRIVVVDAKTPIDAFVSSLDSVTEELRAAEMLRHGRHVKDHIKKLSAKAYNENLKETPDFTVMFLPNESFLYAALESQPDLVEYALQKKILVTTPPTLIGLLKVIRYGWNEEKLAQNALAISEAGVKLHKRLVDFVEAFESIGKHLDKARSEYETGLRRLHSQVLPHARKMETLGAKSNKELPMGEIHSVGGAVDDSDSDVEATL
jgi:DNA recombination protein RmuC